MRITVPTIKNVHRTKLKNDLGRLPILGTIPFVRVSIPTTAACCRLQMTAKGGVSWIGEKTAL